MSITCVHCSTPVPDGSVYCLQCGSLVSDAEGQAAATASMDDRSVQNMTQLLKEDTEGEYDIIRQLGRGGMAVVFLAKEHFLDRQVAIKVLPPELTFGHGVDRFIREAKTAAALDHPNIIPIYRIAPSGKIFWYTMKYLEGQSLEEIVRERELMPLDEVIGILTPVADALEYAHEHHVIHRDIKPANVMIDKRGRIVVTDFGIAKALTEATLTASGSVIGTPYYMSPEQGMGQPVTAASDQYSLGVMVYRMLSGQVPFEGTGAVDILHKHCTMPPPPLKFLTPSLPEHVYHAVGKALAKSPERRFSSVTAFVHALEEPSSEITESDVATIEARRDKSAVSDPKLQDRISTELIATPRPEPKKPGTKSDGRKPSKQLLAAVSFALVVGAGGVGWWVLQQGDGAADQGIPEYPGGQIVPASGDDDVVGDEPEAAVPETAGLTLADLPPNATVLLDGEQQVGTSFDLEPGSHTIRVEAPGYVSVTEQLVLIAGERLRLPVRLDRVPPPTAQARPAEPRVTEPEPAPAPGFLRIAVIRSWANVTIGDRYLERVTVHTDTLPPGEYSVRLERPGFVTVDTSVVVRSGETTPLQVRLTQSTG